jgi:hypothetical protein
MSARISAGQAPCGGWRAGRERGARTCRACVALLDLGGIAYALHPASHGAFRRCHRDPPHRQSEWPKSARGRDRIYFVTPSAAAPPRTFCKFELSFAPASPQFIGAEAGARPRTYSGCGVALTVAEAAL